MPGKSITYDWENPDIAMDRGRGVYGINRRVSIVNKEKSRTLTVFKSCRVCEKNKKVNPDLLITCQINKLCWFVQKCSPKIPTCFQNIVFRKDKL